MVACEDSARVPHAIAHPRALAALKLVHTAIWAAVEACVVYLLWTGIRGRTGRGPALAGAIVGGETAVFLACGARCPLTGLARRLGADRPGVTDVYLPRWLAHNLPGIHAPLVVAIVLLHRRNRRRARASTATPAA
jgi:hypothetical protein